MTQVQVAVEKILRHRNLVLASDRHPAGGEFRPAAPSIRLVGSPDEAHGPEPTRPLLVAVSGIDGSGKTTLAREIESALAARGFRVALIGADPWHQPASIRFAEEDPAAHFYHHAFRFEDLFNRLVDPLKRDGSVTLTANLMRLNPESRYPHTYLFRRIDIILVEGIFLLRRDLRHRYDLAFWVDCTFETALERALSRNQEGLTRERLVSEYRRIYFPAQRIHLAMDWPRFFADSLLPNDVSRATLIAPQRAVLAPRPRRFTDAQSLAF